MAHCLSVKCCSRAWHLKVVPKGNKINILVSVNQWTAKKNSDEAGILVEIRIFCGIKPRNWNFPFLNTDKSCSLINGLAIAYYLVKAYPVMAPIDVKDTWQVHPVLIYGCWYDELNFRLSVVDWDYTLVILGLGLPGRNLWTSLKLRQISRVSCQKGPTHHAYAWQIGPFWQDTLDMWSGLRLCHWWKCGMLSTWQPSITSVLARQTHC